MLPALQEHMGCSAQQLHPETLDVTDKPEWISRWKAAAHSLQHCLPGQSTEAAQCMGTKHVELEAMQLKAHYTNTTAGRTRTTISDKQIMCLKSEEAAVLSEAPQPASRSRINGHRFVQGRELPHGTVAPRWGKNVPFICPATHTLVDSELAVRGHVVSLQQQLHSTSVKDCSSP